MKYRAKNTFGTGKFNFHRGKIYDFVPETYEAYFVAIPEPGDVKQEKKIAEIKIETAAKKPQVQKRKKSRK